MFILAFMVLVIGGSLLLFAARGHKVRSRVNNALWSRESLLLANNVLLVAAMLVALSETGALSCDLSRVEVMGRDISVVSTHPKSQNVTIRSIISAENAVNTASQKVRFDLKPNKVFLFQKESGARIDFG